MSSAASRVAIPATVGASNTARNGRSTPNAARIRFTSRVAARLCPPSMKKSSSTPTCWPPSTSANSPHSRTSSGVRGIRPALAAGTTGAGTGSARRSSLPLALRGNSGSTSTSLGTMYSGSTAPSRRRNAAPSSSAPSSATTYPTSRSSVG